jgi:hypothetical protein
MEMHVTRGQGSEEAPGGIESVKRGYESEWYPTKICLLYSEKRAFRIHTKMLIGDKAYCRCVADDLSMSLRKLERRKSLASSDFMRERKLSF